MEAVFNQDHGFERGGTVEGKEEGRSDTSRRAQLANALERPKLDVDDERGYAAWMKGVCKQAAM